jgi:hypothetical protein
VSFELGVLRNLAGEVVVEVADRHPRIEHRQETSTVHVERDIEHRARVARRALHALEQGDVTLDPGDQLDLALPRLRQAKLLQGTEPVGVPVESVDASHGSSIPRSCR